MPEESRFELRSRGFDLGAQRRVESLPACQWNQGVRRFFEIAFLGLGRFGPSKASKFGEREVGFLLSKSMGIDPKRERRVRVAELIGYPADILARVKCKGRPRMTSVMDPQGTHSKRLRAGY